MDAVKFNGGVTGEPLDLPGVTDPAQSDYLNGVWVSPDFGHSWKQLEGSTAIDNDATSNSALGAPVCKAPTVIAYCPGIQAWYNLWTDPGPDPADRGRRADPARVRARGGLGEPEPVAAPGSTAARRSSSRSSAATTATRPARR